MHWVWLGARKERWVRVLRQDLPFWRTTCPKSENKERERIEIKKENSDRTERKNIHSRRDKVNTGYFGHFSIIL